MSKLDGGGIEATPAHFIARPGGFIEEQNFPPALGKQRRGETPGGTRADDGGVPE